MELKFHSVNTVMREGANFRHARISFYGKSGIGKTLSATKQVPRPVLVLDGEGGCGAVGGAGVSITDKITTPGQMGDILTELENLYKGRSPNLPRTIVWDGITNFFYHSVLKSFGHFKNPLQAQQFAQTAFAALLERFLALPALTIVTGLEKIENTPGKDAQGKEIVLRSIHIDLPPQLRAEVEAKFDVFVYCFGVFDKNTKNGRRLMVSQPVFDIKDEALPIHRTIFAKDRTGNLRTGGMDLGWELIAKALQISAQSAPTEAAPAKLGTPESQTERKQP